MTTYKVFRQDKPIPSPKKGIEECQANLVLVARVEAKNLDRAFDLAKKICPAPVLEEAKK